MSNRNLGHPFAVGDYGPVSDRPAGAALQAGSAQGVYELSYPLVQVNSSGTTNTSVTVISRILNPSTQLKCAFSIAFEPTTPQAINSFGACAWTTTAIRPGGRGRREARLHAIETAIALPRLYEVETAVRCVEVSSVLTIPTTSGGAAIPGQWVIVAEWEPDQPMCADDVAALYSRCSLVPTQLASSPLAP